MFKTTTSPHGTLHSSKAEAFAAAKLLKLGIYSHDKALPCSYVDKDGRFCEGRSDFADLDLEILFEWKLRHLNSKTSKATADRALSRHEEQIALGFIAPGSQADDYNRLKCQFNHSAASIAAKQRAVHEAGGVFILIFGEKPDADTLKRLAKYDILWFQEGSPDFEKFNNLRTLAKIPGIELTWRFAGWEIAFSGVRQTSSLDHSGCKLKQ